MHRLHKCCCVVLKLSRVTAAALTAASLANRLQGLYAHALNLLCPRLGEDSMAMSAHFSDWELLLRASQRLVHSDEHVALRRVRRSLFGSLWTFYELLLWLDGWLCVCSVYSRAAALCSLQFGTLPLEFSPRNRPVGPSVQYRPEGEDWQCFRWEPAGLGALERSFK